MPQIFVASLLAMTGAELEVGDPDPCRYAGGHEHADCDGDEARLPRVHGRSLSTEPDVIRPRCRRSGSTCPFDAGVIGGHLHSAGTGIFLVLRALQVVADGGVSYPLKTCWSKPQRRSEVPKNQSAIGYVRLKFRSIIRRVHGVRYDAGGSSSPTVCGARAGHP